MEKHLLLGDEAIARAAIDAGISGVYAYPGTPSTEITEFIQSYSKKNDLQIASRWAANEKTAMEAALGMSYAGKRALCCMKHVGLNVAADAFVNTAMTGAHGGLVILAADDPSMHSSQNEQDSRFYGEFALIPIFEPSSQQEAYDMTREAFEFSEKHATPVLLRITTRLAHSRAGVNLKSPQKQNHLSLPSDSSRFILLPALARKRYKELLHLQGELEAASVSSGFNHYFEGTDHSKGIIASGIAYNYLMENFPEGIPYPVLKITQYPLPTEFFARISQTCDELLVLEEGAPFIEKQLRGLLDNCLNIRGRLDGTLPRDGELNPDIVARALGVVRAEGMAVPEIVVPRPPALCQGCGHRDMYDALTEVVRRYSEHRVFGDIGCYTLGALPPFRAIHTCVDMGASITMAKGAADAGLWPAVAVIGDSTFTHSGMTGLLDCVNAGANVTIVISDNETTGMTGGQDSAGTGKIEAIVAGIGVDPAHIRVFEPLKKNMEQMKQIIDEELHHSGVSVLIPRRECIQTLKRKKK
ncbi:MAG: thiamine pyrophosphate-dependent enzyme [Bacteroidales bacterium]